MLLRGERSKFLMMVLYVLERKMLLRLAIVFVAICLNGCYYAAKMYSGKDRDVNDVAIIWNPYQSIKKIDGKSVDPFNRNMTEAIHVLPGEHEIEYYALVDYDFDGLYSHSTYEVHRFTAVFQSGKSYYCDEQIDVGSRGVDNKNVGIIVVDFHCYQFPNGFTYPTGRNVFAFPSKEDVAMLESARKKIVEEGAKVEVKVIPSTR